MGNYRQNRGRGRDFDGRNSGRPQMHSAVCSECGKDCEVPFKPTGDKPIYCSDCFKAKRDAEPRRFDSGEKRMYQAVCDKCGKKCEVPFKPTGDKPIYCSDCFGHRDKGKGSKPARPASRSEAGDSNQFELINTKLDKILKALGMDEKEKVEKTVVVKPKKVAKSKVKKAAPKKAKAKKK